MPSSFWRKVERLAHKHGIKETEVLEIGVDVIERTPVQKPEHGSPTLFVPEVGKLSTPVAVRVWKFLAKQFSGAKKISAEQRRLNATKAVLTRWEKRKQETPKS